MALEELKEKYAAFLDSLREKGIPSPEVVFPLVLVLAIVAVGYFVAPAIMSSMQPTRSVSFTVKDQRGNPLAAATVTVVYENGTTLGDQVTDFDGVAEFSGVPLRGATASVYASGYSAKEDISIGEGERIPISLSAVESASSYVPSTRSFAVNVRNTVGQALDNAYVVVNFADGASQGGLTDALGATTFAVADGKQPATIVVETIGFKRVEQSVASDAVSRGAVDIILQPESTTSNSYDEPEISSSGTAVVEVESNGVPVRARVSLVDLVEQEMTSSQSGADGRAAFDGITYGSRFSVKVQADGFLTFISPDYITFGEYTRPILVSLSKKTASRSATVSLEVSDENGAPVSGAEVNVFFQSTNKFLSKEFTNGDGEHSFDAERNTLFYATVYREGYLVGVADNLQAGSTRQIVLAEEVDGSTAALTIKTGTATGTPAANAVVSLYRNGGFFLGIPQFPTNAAGEATINVPRQFRGSDYEVYARAKLDAQVGQSDQVSLTSETTEAQLTVTVVAPPAQFTVTALDAVTGRPVSGAQVTLAVSNSPVAVQRTFSNGSTTFAAAADSDFTFSATAGGYLTYSSSTQRVASNEEKTVSIKLYPLSAGGIQAQFVGLYNSLGEVKEVVNGDYYRAKFLVNIPASSTQSGFYVRIGNAATADEEMAEITSFDTTAAQTIYSSASYDPALECVSETLAAGQNPKWILFQFPSGFAGTKEIALNIRVKREALPTDSIDFSYRAYSLKNEVPLFSPSDVDLANQLMVVPDATLTPTELCHARTATASIPVTQSPLICDESGALCYKIYYEQNGVRGSDGFQTTLGSSLTLHYEILSDYQVSSLSIQSDYFSVTGSQPSQTRLADETPSRSGPQLVSVSAQPGVKTIGAATLRATKSGSFAPITFSFNTASGAPLPTIQHSLTVTGTNSFKVVVTPNQIQASQRSRATVTVLDSLNQPVNDAKVVFYECEETPFNSNEPQELLGDGSSDNGEDGRYSLRLTPISTGWIGVKVSGPDYRTYDSCAIRVTANEFINANPEYLLIEGDSSQKLSQTITVSSSIPATARVSATGTCFGAQRVIKVFPKTFTLREGASPQVTVRIEDNVTADLQCLVHLTATIAPNNIAEADVPVDVKVTCPGCQTTTTASGTVGASTLPSRITLSVDQNNRIDERSYDINLETEPVSCEVRGFRVDPYSQTQATTGSGLWGCQACTTGMGIGTYSCSACIIQAQMAFRCQQCATQGYPANAFYCQNCMSYYGTMQTSAWNAAAYPGQGYNQQGAFTQTQLPQQGYGAIVSPQGTSYQQPYAAYPQMQYPYASGYPPSSSYFDTAAYEDVVTAECTRTELIVTADYHGRQPMPGTGELVMSFQDGTRKRIPIEVVAASQQGTAGGPGTAGYGMFPGVPNSVPQFYQMNYYCQIDSRYSEFQELHLTGQPASLRRTLQYNCPLAFPLTRASLRISTLDRNTGQPCSIQGTVSGQGGSLEISCDFTTQFQQNLPNGETRAFLDIDLASPQNPTTHLQATIELILQKEPGTDEIPQLSLRPITSSDFLCNVRTDESGGITTPGRRVVLNYQFPRGATEATIILIGPNDDEVTWRGLTLNRPVAGRSATSEFRIPTNAAAGQYAFRMIYRPQGETGLVGQNCIFNVQTTGGNQEPGTPEEPRPPSNTPPSNNPPSNNPSSNTPPAPQPNDELDRGNEVGTGSDFCNTPSLHPIRNIVVYNMMQNGGTIVRQSQANTFFSSTGAQAKVKVCLRTDNANVQPNQLKVKFVPETSNAADRISMSSAIGFENCNQLAQNGKRYWICETTSRPASDFGATTAGTYNTVVDALAAITETLYPDYSSAAVSLFKKRFYCNEWPLRRNARSTADLRIGSGASADNAVYQAIHANPLFDCHLAAGSVNFQVRSATSGTTNAHASAASSSSGGRINAVVSGMTPSTSVGHASAAKTISFSTLQKTISFTSRSFNWGTAGVIDFSGTSGATAIELVPVLSADTRYSIPRANWPRVNYNLVCQNIPGGHQFRIRVTFNDNAIAWMNYDGTTVSDATSQADAAIFSAVNCPPNSYHATTPARASTATRTPTAPGTTAPGQPVYVRLNVNYYGGTSLSISMAGFWRDSAQVTFSPSAWALASEDYNSLEDFGQYSSNYVDPTNFLGFTASIQLLKDDSTRFETATSITPRAYSYASEITDDNLYGLGCFHDIYHETINGQDYLVQCKMIPDSISNYFEFQMSCGVFTEGIAEKVSRADRCRAQQASRRRYFRDQPASQEDIIPTSFVLNLNAYAFESQSTVTANTPSFRVMTQQITIPAGQQVETRLTLTRQPSITGAPRDLVGFVNYQARLNRINTAENAIPNTNPLAGDTPTRSPGIQQIVTFPSGQNTITYDDAADRRSVRGHLLYRWKEIYSIANHRIYCRLNQIELVPSNQNQVKVNIICKDAITQNPVPS